MISSVFRSSEKLFGPEKLLLLILGLLRNKLSKCGKFVSIHCIRIYRGNQPLLSEEAGWRFRDVPAEVSLMCASPWLLHFIHPVSGWLPLKKSRRRRKDFELQCCISNDNFTPVLPSPPSPSLSFPSSLPLSAENPLSTFPGQYHMSERESKSTLIND